MRHLGVNIEVPETDRLIPEGLTTGVVAET